ncbi:MAG: site-specific recombinase [Phycisphaerales bacterium]|nr:site-specific recombinase [Phycisphaerales bacterium]
MAQSNDSRAPYNPPVDALYARYSSHAQDDSTSIEVQVEACRRAAGGRCDEYIDRARTGRTTAGREQLLRLLADAAAGRIARVFVYKFDRLGRDAETHTIVRDLEEQGVEVISTTEGKEALARGVQLVVAEHYSRQLAERTREGLKKRHDQHAFTGGISPYGFRIVRGAEGRPQLQIHPDEADIVKQIFGWYLTESIGFKKIAQRMNDRGIPTRNPARKNRMTRRLWSHTTIKSMLQNPTYAGQVRYGVRSMKLNRKTGRRLPRFNDAATVQSYDDPGLAIIDRVSFDRVQQLAPTRAPGMRGKAGSRSTWPFSGFLFCSECGSVYYARRSKNTKGDYRYYTCGCRMAHGKKHCPNSGTVREDQLIERIQQAAREVFADAEAFIAEVLARSEKFVADNRREFDDVRRQAATVDHRRRTLADRLRDPNVPELAARAIYRELADDEAEIQRLQTVVATMGERANDETELLVGDVRREFEAAWRRLADATTPEQLNRIMADFVGPLTVHPDGSFSLKKKETPAEAGVSMLHIAGGGFEPPTSGL